jgi:hypothetical protein
MKTSLKVFHWLPRILCILAILFISLFAADAFEPGLTIWQQLLGFFIHLIPSFILLFILIIAWKWENIGGIIFIILGAGLSPYIYQRNYYNNHSISMSLGILLIITFPFILVGFLFIISHIIKRKNTQQ